ncbi:MAG: IS110 family transposase [Candidatus Symbiothrix sp.]|nr:IS110 family transposase [Candidatus Symbiothrix sp.]
MLVATQNFTRFENSRQFACYAGMAPFDSQSGTSIKVGHLQKPVFRGAKLKSDVSTSLRSARHDALP